MNFQLLSMVGAGAVGLATIFNGVAPGGGSSSSESSAFVQQMKQQCRAGGGELAVEGCECFAEALDEGFDDKTRQLMIVAMKHANSRNPEKAVMRELKAAGFSASDAQDVQRTILKAFHTAIDRCME